MYAIIIDANHRFTEKFEQSGGLHMKHIKTINAPAAKKDLKNAGCGECQTSCQSACKTSCTVANQKCEKR